MRVTALLLAAALAGVSRPSAAAGPVVHRFASGEASRFSSAWWFLTERGSVLVDVPYLSADAGALRTEMAAAGALPLGAAILTGATPERSWGLVHLLSPTTRVWGSRTAGASLEAGFASARERRLRAGVPLASRRASPARQRRPSSSSPRRESSSPAASSGTAFTPRPPARTWARGGGPSGC